MKCRLCDKQQELSRCEEHKYVILTIFPTPLHALESDLYKLVLENFSDIRGKRMTLKELLDLDELEII